MNLDPFQREVLAEFGYRMYRVQGGAMPDTGDPLWQALLRAAGTTALPQVSLAALRSDPAAKRALWPRLRALRVAAPTR